MQYKILASDYDNTLVPFGESKPRQKVVKAVKKLQAAGGRFVLSTGRAYPCVNLKGQLGGIRFDYAITCNGACVVDREGRIVAEHPLTAEEMYALVDFCEDYNYPLQFNFRDACYAYCEYEYLHRGYRQMNSIGLDCVDGEDQDRHLIDMPHAAFAAVRRSTWQILRQSTAIWACTGCRWARRMPTACATTTSCAVEWTKALALPTCAKRWA